MPHRKLIKDRDACFEIDAITRVIKNMTPSKITLMQYDHDSERFTFTLPKVIEGHDMMECNKVEVHYINGDNPGVYTVTDLQVDTEDESKVKCSWLLSQNATKEKGSLRFSLRFSCVADDGTIVYAWNSAIFQGISITEGLYNSKVIVEQYADVLEQWKKELEESGGSGGDTDFVVTGASFHVSAPNVPTPCNFSHTYEDIYEAFSNGKEIRCKAGISDDMFEANLTRINESEAVFVTPDFINGYTVLVWFGRGAGTTAMITIVPAGNDADMSNYYTKTEIDSMLGDIDAALDGIISMQNSYIGGGSV